ncbi:MAG: hypothetical protein ACJ73S_13020 [Mycobacteriales bacterium]
MNPARLIATGAATTLLLLPTPSCTTDHPAHPDPTPKTTKPSATPTDPQSRAEALVHRYFDTYLTALKTRDPSKLQAISGPNCTVCHQEIDFVTRLRDQNQTTDLDKVSVTKVEIATSDKAELPVQTLVTTDWPAYKVVDQNGKAVESGPAYTFQFNMAIKLADQDMTVTLMDALSRIPR